MTVTTSERLSELLDVIGRLDGILGVGRPLSILVLFDPDAAICTALAERGHDVDCCPDLQRAQAMAATHVHVAEDRTEDLARGEGQWDLVIATRGWDRYLSVHSAAATRGLCEWIRLHSTMTVFGCPRRVLSPDLNQLGPYDADRYLDGFRYLGEVSHADSSSVPLIVASDAFLVSRTFSYAAAELSLVAVGTPANGGVRTWLDTARRIVKTEATSEDYMQRSQVAGEALFLSYADPDARDALSLPRVHAFDRGRAIVAMVRDAVVGEPVTDLPAGERHALMREILEEASRYAAQGLFHNDLRPWNVLRLSGATRFIDFADASGNDEDVSGIPQVWALAATMVLAGRPESREREAFHALARSWAAAADVTDQDAYDGPWLALPAVVDGIRMDVALADDQLFASIVQQFMATEGSR